jgi:hypothetical protein
MAVIEYLDIVLGAKTTGLDAGIAKELKQLDILEAKARETDRKMAESSAKKEREAADARNGTRKPLTDTQRCEIAGTSRRKRITGWF